MFPSIVMTVSSIAWGGLFEDSVSGNASGTSSGEVITADTPSETQAESDGTANETTADGETSEETGEAPVQTQTVIERVVEKSGLAFDLNGHIRGDLFAGKMPDYSRGVVKVGYGELALKLQVKKGSYGSAYGDVRFQAGYLGDEHYLGQPSRIEDKGTDLGEFDTRVKLREAYVNVYAGPLDLRFGHQIIVWGRADGINPTNNLTPMDLRVRSPEEDDRRVGNLALRANLNFSPVRIEAVWVPIYSPSYFPVIDVPKPVRFLDPDYPDVDLAKGTTAARFHLILSAFEASASYLHGYSTQPGLNLDSWSFSESGGNLIYIRRTAYEQHVAGFDFATTIGSFGFRGEIAYRYPVDYKNKVYAPNPDLHYVVGFDREFGPISVIAQYIGRYVFDFKDPEDLLYFLTDLNLDTLSERDPKTLNGLPDESIRSKANYELTMINRLIHGQKKSVQHGVSARVAWVGLHDTLSLVLFGMVNISTIEWVLYPKLVYSITDAMTLSVGGEIYVGADDTLFNYIEEVLSAGYTELKISF